MDCCFWRNLAQYLHQNFTLEEHKFQCILQESCFFQNILNILYCSQLTSRPIAWMGLALDTSTTLTAESGNQYIEEQRDIAHIWNGGYSFGKVSLHCFKAIVWSLECAARSHKLGLLIRNRVWMNKAFRAHSLNHYARTQLVQIFWEVEYRREFYTVLGISITMIL